MQNILFDKIEQSLDDFLRYWALHMEEAGYLVFTSGKKCDYVQAFRGVVESIRSLLAEEKSASFAELLGGSRGKIEFFLEEARRHRARGVTWEMFLGCFKTLVHSIEDVIVKGGGSAVEKLDAIRQLRRACDAMETACAAEWGDSGADDALARLQEGNRRQTLEKNKYENIVAATGGLVLIVDNDGRVVEANADADRYFSREKLTGALAWQLLGLCGESVEEVLLAYPSHLSHEVAVLDGEVVFSMRIVPLSDLSLAQPGYLLILSDVTDLVRHRDGLADRVMDQTLALANSEKLFRSIFEAAGDGIMLVDAGGLVVKANLRASEMHGIPLDDLVGIKIGELVSAADGADLETLRENARRGRRQSAEVVGRRGAGGSFPAHVTVNGVKVDGEDFCHLIVRDISRQKALEEKLQDEKSQTEEMNVTLRNVLKTIDQERREVERSVANRIRTHLLPAVEKITREQGQHIRSSYGQVLRDQLIGLTAGFQEELDAGFLRLSRTEVRICQHIRAGCTSKEISEVMNLAFDTVQTHRRNIRRKLDLQGKDVALYSFLRTLSGLSDIDAAS